MMDQAVPPAAFRYYTGEVPEVGDLVYLGNKPDATRWRVTKTNRSQRGVVISLLSQRRRRYDVWACWYALVARKP